MVASLEAVLARLEVERPTPDLAGLGDVYAAWCSKVPFDNVLKLVHLSAGTTGALPGSTSDDFFASWLDTGAGGTCWAGNGAIHDLLAALGFETARVAATMQPGPETPGPNHGSVMVALDGERWIADASILSGVPLRIPEPDETPGSGPLPRIELRDGKPTVIWRTLTAPGGFPCRIDRIGIGADEWDALHQATALRSGFNHAMNTRVLRDGLAGRFRARAAVRLRRTRRGLGRAPRPSRPRSVPDRRARRRGRARCQAARGPADACHPSEAARPLRLRRPRNG